MKNKALISCFLLSFQIVGISKACFIIGDLSGDCQVDIGDLVLMASQWMAPSSCESEAGLVLHWKLNGVSGPTAADSSGAGNNGTVVGASWNPSGGILGGALQFDGTDDYVWSSYQGITGSNPRTCAAWIKTDRPSGEIMTWGDRDIDAARWVVWLDQTGVLRVDVGGGYIFGTTVLTDDLWHHIAVTSGGSTTDNIALYVDGRIETISGIVSRSINTKARATAKLGVFQLLYLKGYYFGGLIDDARIYDRVLSLREIWNLAKTATTDYACADMNMDKIVNLSDIARLAQNWFQDAPRIIVNEFLADNKSKSPLKPGNILDGNGESSDWIEIHNNSGMIIDIGGWYLTDDSSLKTKWQFPAGRPQLVLQPGAYLIVFASGKTQALNPANYPYVDPAGYLHTNFSLSSNGEYLGLFAADGATPIHEYNHIDLGGGRYGYPAQDTDISYGYYYDEERYFSVPTPGADNIKSPFEEVAAKPDVNFKGGCYVNAVDVTMNCGTPGAFIRYTTNGTVPSLVNGFEYTGPIHLSSLTTILAKAFKPGLQPSETRIETYIFVDPAVAPFNSNLPIVVVDTLGAEIPIDKINRPYVDCRVVIVDTDDATGRASVTGPEHFEGWGQIRRRGESTYGQGHYALEIQDEYRQDKAVSLLGMPAESDWVLSWDTIDYTMMKKGLAYKWFTDMGHYAPRQRYVEVYLNTDGGKISSSDYQGLYMLREKIKRDENRVDIARLDASHNLEPKVSGGYIIKCDKVNDGDTLLADGPLGLVDPDYLEAATYGISYTGGGKPIIDEPGPLEITQLQINWVADYINEFHSVLWQNTSSIYYPGPGAKYTDYIDVTSWVDHGLLEQVCADSDAFWGSYHTHKERDGKHYSGPPWDYDRGFHNNSGSYDQPYNAWKTNSAIFGKWHQKLQENLEYKMLLADRWFQHREDVLNTAKTMAYIDQTAALISEARSRPKKTYPKPFTEEVGLFKDWITNRLNYLDGEIASRFAKKPPIFSLVGGYVNPGTPLDISLPSGASGDIYYTSNDEDPRLAGGGVNPNASIFGSTGRIVLESENFEAGMGNWLNVSSGDTHDWTRDSGGTPSSSTGPASGALGSTWYMYLEASDASVASNNVILEGPSIDGTGRELTFYYHMYGSNIGTLYVDVYSGGSWTNGIWSKTGQQHTSGTVAYTQATVNLSAYTGTIKVRFRAVAAGGSKGDMAIDDIEITKDAGGGVLTLNNSTCVKARIKDGSNWSAMNTEVYAVGPVLENLRISELMYHPSDPTPTEITAAGDPNLTDEDFEFIELKNIGGTAINLNLVHFTDGIDFTFGDYTLAADGYAVLVKNQAAFAARYSTSGINIIPGSYLGALDNGGEEIVLRDAIGAEIHDFDYKDSWYELTDGPGFSLTMVNPASTDPDDWDRKSGWRASLAEGGTPGSSDTTLAADSIVINELLAHSHGTASDWIELYNKTGQNINIGGWFLSDDNADLNVMRKYEIPANTVINAHSYLVFTEATSFGKSSLPEGKGFGLSEGGETLYLYSGESGQVTGYYQTEENFDASETGVTFGRYEKAELSGGYDFVRQSSPSQGTVNNGPLIPAIVITEIYYNPPSGGAYEFVELYNRSGSAVMLMSEARTETSPGVFIAESIPWRLEGTGFKFPVGTTIPAYTRILVAKTPALYSSAPCVVYGPYDGALDNGGEQIEIQIPGDMEYGQPRYWIPIEKVDYDDTAPWPTSADGGGHSLYRINVNTYGRDYSNWNAAAPSPGQ